MAREQITHNRIVVERPLPPAVEYPPGHPGELLEAVVSVEVPRRNLHVEWNRTGGSGVLGVPHDVGWVQLGIDVTVADLRSLLDHAIRQADLEARKHEDIGELDVEQFQVRLSSDVLDRREVNLAIGALRRARDVAYGKDA